MAAANFLTGPGMDADVYAETGTSLGADSNDMVSDAASSNPGDRGTSVHVALFALVAVAFIVLLRRNGFRDMVAQ